MSKPSAAIKPAYSTRYPCLQVACDYFTAHGDPLPHEPVYTFGDLEYLKAVEGMWSAWMRDSNCTDPISFSAGKEHLKQAKSFTRVSAYPSWML